MNTAASTPAGPVDMENSFLGIEYNVWWSPTDSAYVAVNLDYAPYIHADPRSARAAVDGLQSEIYANMIAASPLPVTGCAA